MAYRFLLLIFSFLISTSALVGQYDFTAVLPNLEGQDLLEQLEDDFKPSSVLPYDIARDTMFRRVDGRNDSLSCVYTSHRLWMSPGLDPTQAVFLNGAANGINTEHSWPRSYGAQSGSPLSDMHHLFPTRVDVNGDRGVLPFLEIPDNQTDSWYYQNSELSSIPNSNIDLYAERSSSAFEPPEHMKGNIARAMMYFKAIYPSQSNQAPSDFFPSMQATLCQWHSQDPVDSLEWHRTFAIAAYQSGRPNPFVLDCTLPQRAFCPQTQINCNPGVSNIKTLEDISIQLFPNPSNGIFQLEIGEALTDDLQINIYNGLGKRVFFENYSSLSNGDRIDIEVILLPGVYWLSVNNDQQQTSRRILIQ